jgi:hypothetical protein
MRLTMAAPVRGAARPGCATPISEGQTTLVAQFASRRIQEHQKSSKTMGILFHQDWKKADPDYVRRFGNYQGYLDAVNQQQILQAMWAAAGAGFRDRWVREILSDASAAQGVHDVMIEQGTHQPENLRSGGFTLHFTMSNDRGRAYHLYIKQRDNGAIYVNEVSFMRSGHLFSDFA